MLWLGVIILCLMCDLFCGKPAPPSRQMRIVGWNCNEFIYEDSRGQTYERDPDGHFIPTGMTGYKGAN